MKRVLSSRVPAKHGDWVELSDDEAGHATRVLRLGDGAIVEAMDGKGHAALCHIRVRGKRTYLELAEVAEKRESPANEVVPVTIELAVLKGDAMEWAVEKCVELGISRLTPVFTAHTVIQLGRKTPEDFQQRWQKIADQALKQCGRLESMIVDAPYSLDEALARASDDTPRLWCDEASRVGSKPLPLWLSENRGTPAVRILIGPEGGWSETERQLLERTSVPVSLGPLVLRAETAALAASSLAAAHFHT